MTHVRGPVPTITLEEAALVLPHIEGVVELRELSRRLRSAITADPIWRTPLR